ncbi:MAG TPA: glycosyltransferase [Burkholderiales bacterium]|nr:glycosyltransferase [Burkholderiales bacterium]
MALPLAIGASPARIVYDCMDELTAFKSAAPQLLERERALMQVADVVFTGGPSLYRSRLGKHPNLHCFPSSVDRAHFERARIAAVHAAQESLPTPRLGFFGVIDERLDYRLIGALAESHPQWQIMMVGPVAKVGPWALPRAANLHWMGRHAYAELPALLAGWDVCLLPFALNHATRFISPTKTLEYLAAGRPVISTAIHDVIDLYSDVVRIGDDVDDFIAACEAALSEGIEAREQRERAARAHLDRTSWDRTAAAMRGILEGAGDSAARSGRPRATAAPARLLEARNIVLGAGPAGLSAAYHLGAGSLLLEATGRVGGECRWSSIADLPSTRARSSSSPRIRTYSRWWSDCWATTCIGRSARRGHIRTAFMCAMPWAMCASPIRCAAASRR